MTETREDYQTQAIERTADDLGKFSKQPRFKGKDGVFNALTRFLRTLEMQEIDPPPYRADSRKRDKWLRGAWRIEPHWAGVINQCVLVDSSRGWTMTGGRNQVYRFTTVLHGADGGGGWRNYVRKSSLSYRVTDIGNLTETGREGDGGPLRAIYHLDSARCRWTGDLDEPLRYYPGRGGSMQRWLPDDFFNVVSMPSDDEKFNGLGFCQTSRAFEILRILYGVYKHDQEMVGAAMPRGLLLLQGIEESQWDTAMAGRKTGQEALERKYFGGVFILAGAGADKVDAKLIALSQLPASFNREVFVDQCMAAYALVSGYDISEFWPAKFGSLGRGSEIQTQHRKATSKGSLEFPHAWQEKFQNELPDTLQFQFEERDAEGELLDAEVAQAWAEVARTLSDSDQLGETGLLLKEQALSLLVDKGVIPPEYTEFEEDTQSTDEAQEKRIRERALESPQVRRAIERFPDEPIIQYNWTPRRVTERVLWESGYAATRPRVWPVTRQSDADEVLYEAPDGDFTITQADVDRSIEQGRRRAGPEFAELLTAETVE